MFGQTYPIDGGDLHLLRSLFTTLQLALADSVQLQLLRFGHRGLEIDAGDAVEVAGVSEPGQDLRDAFAALHGEGEVEVVFAVGLVSGGRSGRGE